MFVRSTATLSRNPLQGADRRGRTVVSRIVGLLLVWQGRSRERQILAGLDSRMLKDIGLDRADVVREADKPFWRA